MDSGLPKGMDIEEYYYLWVAMLKDGTVIHQFDENGHERSTHTAYNPTKLAYLSLLPQKKNLSHVIIKAEEGKKPIYFRTKVCTMNMGSGQSRLIKVYTGYGRELTANGKKVRHITYIDPDTGIHFVADDI